MYNRQPKLPIHLIVPTNSDDGAKSSDGVTNGVQRHDVDFQETFAQMVDLRNQIKPVAQTKHSGCAETTKEKLRQEKRVPGKTKRGRFYCCMF